jgi:hypothetical protein
MGVQQIDSCRLQRLESRLFPLVKIAVRHRRVVFRTLRPESQHERHGINHACIIAHRLGAAANRVAFLVAKGLVPGNQVSSNQALNATEH